MKFRYRDAWVPILCCWGLALPVLASERPPVERRFQAMIVSVDPSRQMLRIRHKPTGYETDVTWDEKSVITARIAYDMDEVPEGWVECFVNQVDADRQALSGIGILRALPKGSMPSKGMDAVRQNGLFRAQLIRVPVDNEACREEGLLLTRKREARYELEVNGHRWILKSKHGLHPKLFRDVIWTPTHLSAGLLCREFVYSAKTGGARLVSLLAVPNQRVEPEMPTGGPTGTTVERIDQEIRRLREAYAKAAAEVKRIAPVTVNVSPEVTLKGEPVTVSLEAWASRSPNAAMTLTTGYLRAQAQRSTLPLTWKARETSDGLTRYTVQARLPELPVGQHLVSWHCDVGGDIPEFWRSFAVTDAKTPVVMLHFTTGKPNAEFETYRLPYDYWEEGLLQLLGGPFGTRKTPACAADWLARSREHRRRGANPNMHIIQGNYAGRTGWPAPIPVQFLEEPEEVQRAVFKAVLELGPWAGFDSEAFFGFTAYEFGTRTVDIARESGVRLIGSLCIHQNWQDGSWGINHTGRPLRPYFAAADDFRKAGPGGDTGVVMVSQHDKSLLWTEYGLGVFEPAWLEKAWVGGGGGGRAVFDEIFLSRHLDLANAVIENAANQRVPYFQSVGIEFSKEDPEEMTTKANALLLRYLVRRAGEGAVVFCHQGAAGAFYRSHYRETPETLFYDADFWCGLKASESVISSWKPVDYPDLMHIENARYSAYFKKGECLPAYHWDYSRAWHYPDWGNEALPRNPVHVLVPGEHDKFAVTPKITDTRKMRLRCDREETTGATVYRVRLEAAEAITALPLALWDIPRTRETGGGWWDITGATRFLPVIAPYTGNLSGILEVDAKPGVNEYLLTVRSATRPPQTQDILLETLHAKVFTRDGQHLAYVWPTRPWETAFDLAVPVGRDVQYYAAPKGERVDLHPGRHRLAIAKESWARIVGLNHAELAVALRDRKIQ